MSGNNFSGPQAMAMISNIEAFIKANGRATAGDIATKFNIGTGTANNYTREMWLQGLIRHVPTGAGRSQPYVWEIGEDPNASSTVEPMLQPSRRVVKSWTPHHARNWFDCLLFGVPSVLQAVA